MSNIDEKNYAGKKRFSSKERAMDHAKSMEDQGYLTKYSKGSTYFRSSHSKFPHVITHYFRDKDHLNQFRRERYAERKKMKEDIHPIRKEYDSLKKHDIKTLRNIIKSNNRVHDTSEYRTKDHAITKILTDKHGRKKMDQVFGEEVAVNAVGAGNVAGLGVGPQGEPGVKSSRVLKRFKKFIVSK
jgi:hypothetical protein